MDSTDEESREGIERPACVLLIIDQAIIVSITESVKIGKHLLWSSTHQPYGEIPARVGGPPELR